MTGQGDEHQSEKIHEWGEAVPASSGRPQPGARAATETARSTVPPGFVYRRTRRASYLLPMGGAWSWLASGYR